MASWMPGCNHPLFYPSYSGEEMYSNYYSSVPSYYPPAPAVYQPPDWTSSPLQLPTLPDSTPQSKQGGGSRCLARDSPKKSSRRSLFDGGDQNKVSKARDFLDSLLDIPDICPEEDTILCGGGRSDLVPGTSRPEPAYPTPEQSFDHPFLNTRPAPKRPHPSAQQEPLEKRQRVDPAWTIPNPLPPAPTPQPASQQHRCKDCGKTYRHRSSLRAHRRVHKGQTYTCNTCGRNFAHRSTLTKHDRTHSNLCPFVCTVCSATFTQSGNLYRHVRNVHQEEPYFL